MSKTGINWCDDTWNPVRGCTRVSEGCRNCYAEVQAARIVRMDKAKGRSSKYDGLVEIKPRRQYQIGPDGNPTGKFRTHGTRAYWAGKVAFDVEVLAAPLKRHKPTTYFVNSMSDLFHDGFTNEQIAAVFGVMAATPQHTFIMLTKRAQRMREWFEWAGKTEPSCHPYGAARGVRWYAWDCGIEQCSPAYSAGSPPIWPWPLPNVILGVSVENQATADERIPHLLATPAAVRAISAEPLLGPLDVAKYMWPVHWSWDSKYATPQEALAAGARAEKRRQALVSAPAAFLDWVVTGCESGPNARPCEVDWLRSLAVQCAAAKVPFWLKQARADELGYGCVIENGRMLPLPLTTGPGSTRKPGGIIDLPYLDGVQWAQRPEVRR